MMEAGSKVETGDFTYRLGKRRDGSSREEREEESRRKERKKREGRRRKRGDQARGKGRSRAVEGGSTAARRATAEPKGHSEEQRR